jgi:hypothetical protein
MKPMKVKNNTILRNCPLTYNEWMEYISKSIKRECVNPKMKMTKKELGL